MNILKTSDFSLVAFAICEGAKIIEIDRSERKAVFVLQTTDEEEAKNRFWGNEKVGVSDFVNAQREAKKRLFSDAF